MHISVYRNTIFYVWFTDYYGLMTENNREERSEGIYTQWKTTECRTFRTRSFKLKMPTNNSERNDRVFRKILYYPKMNYSFGKFVQKRSRISN